MNDLFTDLPELHPGESNNTYSKKKPSRYVIKTGIRTKDDVLTLQNCRPNIERDIRIYERAIELWNDGHRRLNYNDLPEELKTHKNRHSFTDRFKVAEGDEQCCHTILAHLSEGRPLLHPSGHQPASFHHCAGSGAHTVIPRQLLFRGTTHVTVRTDWERRAS